jgi:hypothetical protein
MFANGLFFSLLLLFAAALCLFGAGILIDGIIRLGVEWHARSLAPPANGNEQVEKPSVGERAA